MYAKQNGTKLSEIVGSPVSSLTTALLTQKTINCVAAAGDDDDEHKSVT
jgi:hypothetical protein